MICPVCGVEASITRSAYQVEGDKAPDTETKVYSVLHFSCRNKSCRMFDREIGTVRHAINTEPAEPAGTYGKEDAEDEKECL